MNKLTRSVVKAKIQDGDRIFVATNHPYAHQTVEHQCCWPKVIGAIGEKGAWYSTLRAISRGNPDYIAYLIGDIGALRCPAMEHP